MTSQPVPAPRTARERVRVELTREIKEAARRQLAVEGAPTISLRAVARELNMSSSAVYRYFPSRDALLTALIVDAYDSQATAAEVAESTIRRGDLAGRWRALCRGLRTWALDHPHEWALIYGSPVPGYAAPTDTIEPALRVPLLIAALISDLVKSGRYDRTKAEPVPAKVRAAMAGLLEALPADAPAALMVRGTMAWTYLVGAISAELFGHRFNGIVDYDTFFDYETKSIGAYVGLG